MATRDSTIWKWTGKRFKYVGATDVTHRRVTVYASPRMAVQFELDRRGIRKIALGRELAEATRSAVVHRAMPFAIQNSPRGDTLDYVSSWRASDTHVVIAGMRRVATKLVNVSAHAAAVEWGRGGRAGVLRRTLAHLNATSPIGLEKAARAAARQPWNPELHPRGTGGRFAPKPQSQSQRRRQGKQSARAGELVAFEAMVSNSVADHVRKQRR